MTDITQAGAKSETRERLVPLLLTLAIIAVDQALKAVILLTVPVNTIGASLAGGILRIIHARNLGIAFSIGRGLPESTRALVFTLVPIVVLGALMVFYFRSDEFTALQRWAIAGILGGGVGNLIDRVFRPGGVVDFIDVKFFGLFGLDRWPTFNVADASVVVCGILLLLSIFIQEGSKDHE